ncbi:hypothetical protein [Nocardioides zhouii]|uniref:Uncharacterized protein n=1 Tax=Nocardioides zhouii TaxID=1168729 RepID=A0A4Q2SX22_9ACTN|nr:hypothetical protein [Nocardioides zhouii]RYC10452.1 hypothetical protein EUA94_13075 [Nocardioides zhouii]
MELPFVLNGVSGVVRVDHRRNSDPASVGCQPDTVDYPICTATIERPFRGYDSLMGWVQLVRSDDNVSGGERFEMDPLAFLGDQSHPYCWLGLNPTLFDAPSRPGRIDMDWMAHSFLCVPDDVGSGLEARPMLGFSWGFVARGGEITLVPPVQLGDADWDQHLDTLRGKHPGWHFSPGLADLS